MSMSHFKKYFLTGLVVWIPITVTYLIITFIIDFVDNILNQVPLAYQPGALLGIKIPGINLFFLALILFLTGLISANYFAKKFGHVGENLLNRIPLVRSIYSTVKETIHFVLSPKNNAFNSAIMLEYPRKGVFSIGFLTNNNVPKNIQRGSKKKLVIAFIPTTPNPTSGYMVMIPESEYTKLDITIDQALKMIISLGTIVPKESP
jgi:uncharacterized membrane protein